MSYADDPTQIFPNESVVFCDDSTNPVHGTLYNDLFGGIIIQLNTSFK